MWSASPRLAFHLGIALITIRGLLAQPGASSLEFEVASVKPSDPAARNPNIVLGEGESLTISSVPLRGIITYAYDIRDFQLTGGPDWTNDERFDVVARSAGMQEPNGQPRNRVARTRERLRSLLSDRFGLRVHIST